MPRQGDVKSHLAKTRGLEIHCWATRVALIRGGGGGLKKNNIKSTKIIDVYSSTENIKLISRF